MVINTGTNINATIKSSPNELFSELIKLSAFCENAILVAASEVSSRKYFFKLVFIRWSFVCFK